jgi:hypothetical protein
VNGLGVLGVDKGRLWLGWIWVRVFVESYPANVIFLPGRLGLSIDGVGSANLTRVLGLLGGPVSTTIESSVELGSTIGVLGCRRLISVIFDCQGGLAGGLSLAGMSGEARPGSILEDAMALYLLGIEKWTPKLVRCRTVSNENAVCC